MTQGDGVVPFQCDTLIAWRVGGQKCAFLSDIIYGRPLIKMQFLCELCNKEKNVGCVQHSRKHKESSNQPKSFAWLILLNLLLLPYLGLFVSASFAYACLLLNPQLHSIAYKQSLIVKSLSVCLFD